MDLADVAARADVVRVRDEQQVLVVALGEHERAVADEVARARRPVGRRAARRRASATGTPRPTRARTGSSCAAGRAAPRACGRRSRAPRRRRAGTRSSRARRAICCHVQAKSSAVSGSPSLQRAPSRSRNRYVRPSPETRRLSASAGTTFRSRSTASRPRNRCPTTRGRLGRVDVARGRGVGRRSGRARSRSARSARAARLVDAAAERLVVGVLGAREVEGEVPRERDLEQRLAGAGRRRRARARKRARALVVRDGLLVGVDGARRVAGLQQVVGRLRRLVRLGEVAREQRVVPGRPRRPSAARSPRRPAGGGAGGAVSTRLA